MQVNSDSTVSMMDGITLSKDDFLTLVGGMLQQLATKEVPKPPPPSIEVLAIEKANYIRTRYRYGDYTGVELENAFEGFKLDYPERMHFLLDWVTAT